MGRNTLKSRGVASVSGRKATKAGHSPGTLSIVGREAGVAPRERAPATGDVMEFRPVIELVVRDGRPPWAQRLTPRQWELAGLVGEGFDDQTIAAIIGRSGKTVRNGCLLSEPGRGRWAEWAPRVERPGLERRLLNESASSLARAAL